MKANLVYKTGDNYINLFENRLEFIDYSCTNQVKTEEKLRDIFSMEIDNKDGEFKILINPQELNIKEVKYHKNVDNMYDFSDLEELNVRFDCCDKEEFMSKIANMMLNSQLVLSGLFRRFSDVLSFEDQKRFLLAEINDNQDEQINVLSKFLNDRCEEKDSYLFFRELEEYCSNIYKLEKDNKNTIKK